MDFHISKFQSNLQKSLKNSVRMAQQEKVRSICKEDIFMVPMDKMRTGIIQQDSANDSSLEFTLIRQAHHVYLYHSYFVFYQQWYPHNDQEIVDLTFFYFRGDMYPTSLSLSRETWPPQYLCYHLIIVFVRLCRHCRYSARCHRSSAPHQGAWP